MITERQVVHQAKADAAKRKATGEPLGWSEAITEAPAADDLPASWAPVYRRAYATELVKRGLALPAAPSGRSSGPSGESKLARRTLRATPGEFAEHDRKAKETGIPWATWVRRKLSAP